MRTNPKEGPALEQAITGYNDSKWHHYGVSISSAASGRRNWLITLDGKLQGLELRIPKDWLRIQVFWR